MTKQDRKEFTLFCRQATNRQIVNIYHDEKAARRYAYAQIAREEAIRRGLL